MAVFDGIKKGIDKQLKKQQIINMVTWGKINPNGVPDWLNKIISLFSYEYIPYEKRDVALIETTKYDYKVNLISNYLVRHTPSGATCYIIPPPPQGMQLVYGPAETWEVSRKLNEGYLNSLLDNWDEKIVSLLKRDDDRFPPEKITVFALNINQARTVLFSGKFNELPGETDKLSKDEFREFN